MSSRTHHIYSCGISAKGKGVLNVYQLDRQELKNIHEETNALDCGIKCCTFGASRVQQRQVAVGDYNGGLHIFDLSQLGTTLPKVYSVKAHEGLVNCIDGIGGNSISFGAPELATGGKDGIARVWDPRVADPVIVFEPNTGTASRDCWSVCFGDAFSASDRCLAAGFDNGDVKLLDMRTNQIRWETNVSNGVTSVEFDRNDIEMNKLLATTLESNFYTFDLKTRHPKYGFSFLKETAHRSTIWLSRSLPQNKDIFCTGGGNGGLNIYKYIYPLERSQKHPNDNLPMGKMGTNQLLNSRVISTQPVTSFDWSPDKAGLCCLSCLDQTIRVYIVTKLEKY